MQQARRNRQAVPDREHGVVVGIDVSKRWVDYGPYWSDRRGQVRRAPQRMSGFLEMEAQLQELRQQGHEVWVGLEPTGAYSVCVQEWLVGRGWRVVQVNPYHVHRTQEVRDSSPGTSDCKATGVIADLVWQGCYQQALRLDGVYAQLRAASAEWASLGRRRTSVGNEFQALLQVWFPELVGLYRDALCLTVRGLVRRYREVPAIVKAGKGSLRRTVKRACRGRGMQRVDEIWQAARESVAPTIGQAARRQAMLGLLAVLEAIERRQETLRGEMAQLLSRVLEGPCLLSVPGAGVVTVAGLLGECGDMGAYGSYGQLEKLVGLNLYNLSSGQYRGRCRVSKRGRGRARYVLCQMAMWQTRKGELWHEWAQAAKARGKRAPQIRVAVARKLLALIYALARDRALYQAQRCVAGDGTADGLPALQGTPAQLAAA
jgi:transposase